MRATGWSMSANCRCTACTSGWTRSASTRRTTPRAPAWTWSRNPIGWLIELSGVALPAAVLRTVRLALDIGAPDEPPAEESFERTAAFAWLQEHAGEHGFAMSYPRDNPHGIVYEPWHWRYAAA